MKNDLAVFEGHEIRRVYDGRTETWWFSVVDIIRVLTQQPNYKLAQNYWKVLKHRLNKEGSQLVTNCNQLKLLGAHICLPHAHAVIVAMAGGRAGRRMMFDC
jgi:hypothetical protein